MFETLITHFACPLYMGKQIAEEAGIPEPKFREIWDTTDDARTLGKRTFEDVIEEILKVNNRYSTELFERIVRKRKQSKVACFEHLHPQILPMLEALKEKQVKIGLITNCYFEERDVIRNSILFPYFDAVCMSCELGMKKPEAAIFQKCMDELAVAPEECLYVGDGGSFELEAARSLGMHPLQATWYLIEGAKQPAKRNVEFRQAETPMEVYHRGDMISVDETELSGMAEIILSADDKAKIYSVPAEIAYDLQKYCLEFASDWIWHGPESAKYLKRFGNQYVACYNADDFIVYLNQWVYPECPSSLVKELDYYDYELPEEYRKYPKFNF